MLFSPEELQALATLFNRVPLSPAEMLWVQGFLNRLVSFCQPPETEPLADDAVADALDNP